MPRKTKGKATRQELLFVLNWAGNDTLAAKAAGYKHPNKQGPKIAARPHVAELIRKKQDALAKQSGKDLGRSIRITRNDIINRLDELSQKAESDSTKVSALSQLADIFGLRAKDSKADLFTGWTDEELEEYSRTGKLPKRLFGGE